MNFGNRQPRPMQDVSNLNLICVECGAEIKELPFMPQKREDGTYGRLYCRECNRNRRGFRPAGGFRRKDRRF